MTFRVGQEVVCVNDTLGAFSVPGYSYSGELHGLRKGQIYTIRAIVVDIAPPWPGVGLYLNEIDRGIMPHRGFEPPYVAARFRPIVKTDISLLEEIARKVTQGKRVKIDA